MNANEYESTFSKFIVDSFDVIFSTYFVLKQNFCRYPNSEKMGPPLNYGPWNKNICIDKITSFPHWGNRSTHVTNIQKICRIEILLLLKIK